MTDIPRIQFEHNGEILNLTPKECAEHPDCLFTNKGTIYKHLKECERRGLTARQVAGFDKCPKQKRNTIAKRYKAIYRGYEYDLTIEQWCDFLNKRIYKADNLTSNTMRARFYAQKKGSGYTNEQCLGIKERPTPRKYKNNEPMVSVKKDMKNIRFAAQWLRCRLA